MTPLDLDAIDARANAATVWGPDECELRVEDGEPWAPQGATLGDTLVTLGDTYDGSAGDWSFLAHAREDVPALTAEVRRLRALVATLVTHERDNSHSHACVGTWDRSNGAPLGGAPCARCHTFADAREAIGLPRWPTRDEYHQRAEDRSPTCEHPAACGCGAELYTHTTARTALRRSP